MHFVSFAVILTYFWSQTLLVKCPAQEVTLAIEPIQINWLSCLGVNQASDHKPALCRFCNSYKAYRFTKIYQEYHA